MRDMSDDDAAEIIRELRSIRVTIAGVERLLERIAALTNEIATALAARTEGMSQ